MKTISLLNYEVRYKFISASQIFNFLGPWANLHHLPFGQRFKEAEAVIERRNQKDQFFSRLEKDIIENGIIDPVVINSGWFPDVFWNRFPTEVKMKGMQKVDACITIGGSRLWFANKYKLKVPCLINDFVGRHTDGELITSIHQINEKYHSTPHFIEFTDSGINIVAEKNTQWEYKESDESIIARQESIKNRKIGKRKY